MDQWLLTNQNVFSALGAQANPAILFFPPATALRPGRRAVGVYPSCFSDGL